MVDQVSSRTTNVAPVAAPTRVAAPRTVADTTPSPAQTTVPPSTLAQTMAASPPVDLERVQRIKAAVAEGRFPLTPSTIADSLIAMKYEWMRHDEA